MSKHLFWKLCLIFALGIVTLFYLISEITRLTEEKMSMLAMEHRQEITQWGKHAELLYKQGDNTALEAYLQKLKAQEQTWMAVVSYDYSKVVGDPIEQVYTGEQTLGRSVDWKIHLYFAVNPVMEVPFDDVRVSYLVQLPDRMRPGGYWQYAKLALRIIVPIVLLAVLSLLLYRHIMKPLRQLQQATRHFSAGNFDSRAGQLMGKRNDEFSDLANTFDDMAERIGEQIVNQRQLIADLSHELRTPLARLDIAVEALESLENEQSSKNIDRIARESRHIRKLVEDTLSLAWLENEKPELQQESVDLVDLLDVLIDDARFEFPDREIITRLPNSVEIENSSHRAAGQAIENILRNALRHTPAGKQVEVSLIEQEQAVKVTILDQGIGVPENLLKAIFKPFFRVDKARERNGNSFGLGLALAKRQLAAIRGSVNAVNSSSGGLLMSVTLPKS